MKIRSITCFIDPGRPVDEGLMQRVGSFARAARAAFEASGYEVQTTRLACVPFPRLLRDIQSTGWEEAAVRLAVGMERLSRESGFEYIALGPALPGRAQSYTAIPAMLAATDNVFVSGLMTTSRGGISLLAVKACGEVIRRAASLSPDGFANLRFAALANVAPGSPFFPAAYHTGGAPAFALATESADLAVQAFSAAGSLARGREELTTQIEGHASRLAAVAGELQAAHGVTFGGIDFSLAPFPTESASLGTAMERLGVPGVGSPGSLAAAAILTEAIDRARFPRAGFCGLMLPVLEDAALAKRAAEGALTVGDLLLYSAVCGTGLDTVPLPGDTPSGRLSALLLDLATLAQRLRKPLTARLMPIPGKAAGEPTEFDFGFFANSRVMALKGGLLHSGLAGDETFSVRKLRRQAD